MGVIYDKSKGKTPYVAQISLMDVKAYKIGKFDCPLKAHKAYQEKKSSYMKEVAKDFYERGEIEYRVYQAINYRADMIIDDMTSDRITTKI